MSQTQQHSNSRKMEKEKPKQEHKQRGKQGNATGYECAEQLAQGKSIEVATTTNCKTKCLYKKMQQHAETQGILLAAACI